MGKVNRTMYLLLCNEMTDYLSVTEDRKYKRNELLLILHKHHYTVVGVIQKWVEQKKWLNCLTELNIYFNVTILPLYIPSQTDFCCV